MKRILLFLLIMCPNMGGADNAKVVIHNPEHLTIVNDIMLQRIFTLKEPRWPDGSSIKVFTRSNDSIEYKNFIMNVLNMSIYAYKRHVEAQLYTTATNTITIVRSREQMIDSINKTRNSIGYVDGVVYRNGSSVMVIDDVFNK